MLRSELQRLKKITNVCRSDQCTQTVEEQSLMSSTIVSTKLKKLLLLLLYQLLQYIFS